MSLNNKSKKYFTDIVLKQLITKEQFNVLEKEYQNNYYNKYGSCYKDDIYSICYYDDIGQDVSYVLNDNNKYICTKCNEMIIKCFCDLIPI